jgi:hypothetical protein
MSQSFLEGFNIKDLSFNPVEKIIEGILKSLTLMTKVQGKMCLPYLLEIYKDHFDFLLGLAFTNSGPNNNARTFPHICEAILPVTLKKY